MFAYESEGPGFEPQLGVIAQEPANEALLDEKATQAAGRCPVNVIEDNVATIHMMRRVHGGALVERSSNK